MNHNQTSIEGQDPAYKPPPQPPPDDGIRRRYVLHSEKDNYDFVTQRCAAKPTKYVKMYNDQIKDGR